LSGVPGSEAEYRSEFLELLVFRLILREVLAIFRR
jgi:hypothetical protein